MVPVVPTQFLCLEVSYPVKQVMGSITIDPLQVALRSMELPTLEEAFKKEGILMSASTTVANGEARAAYRLKIPPGYSYRYPLPRLGGELAFGANKSGAPIITVPAGYRDEAAESIGREIILQEQKVVSDAGNSVAFFLAPKRGARVSYTIGLLNATVQVEVLGWLRS